MYRIEINIGKPDAPKWKMVRGADSGPWGASNLADAQKQMRAVMFSNRSMAHLAAGNADAALVDCNAALQLEPEPGRSQESLLRGRLYVP